jgi:hypothetical protein
MRALYVLNLCLTSGVLGIGSLPKTNTRLASDVVVKLSLSERGAK